MTNHQKNWQSKKLMELCGDFKKNIVDGPFGSDLKRSDYKTNGIPVLKIQNIKETGINQKKLDYVTEQKYQQLKRHSFTVGDIIMTKLGDPLGVCALVEEIDRGIIVADLVRIRPVSINTKYLHLYLNSPEVRNFINSKQKGTTRPRVKLAIVRGLEILFPQDINDQQKIVDKIDELFSVIDHNADALRATKKNLINLRRKILDIAFKGKLTSEYSDPDFNFNSTMKKLEDSRRKLFSTFKNGRYKQASNKVRKINSKWLEIPLESFGLVETGATPLRGNSEYWKNGTIPWVTSTVVNQQKVTAASELITDKALKETNTKLLPIGTLLIAMYGEGKTRGKVSELMIEAATNQALAGVILSEEAEQYKEFIKLYLYKNYEDLRRLASGGVQPNLNLTMIKEMQIPFPSKKKQMAIVDILNLYLSIIDNSLTQIDQILALTNGTKQSILKQAFEGKLV